MNKASILKLKLGDILIQLLILVSAMITWLIDHDVALWLVYAVLGGWQILSVIVHLVMKSLPGGALRRVYLYLLVLVVVIFLVGLLVPIALVYLFYFLLFLSPVMAVYYMVLGVIEYMQLKEAKQ